MNYTADNRLPKQVITTTLGYNVWYALSYELTNLLIDYDTRWELNPWVLKVRNYCKPDWVEWKTQSTMKSVDLQAESIKAAWQKQEQTQNQPVIIQHRPDQSKAQSLLGGELEIRAPY